MRPLRIDFGAFGPYAGEEHIDFEKIAQKGLFLICGETGSGKTTMLDAMTFALYGMSSGNMRDDFEAMRCTNADYEATTYVKFTFEVNGEVYIFERRLERKRKNLSKSYNMMKKDPDGVFRVLMENPKEKDLNKKATELIGLEYSQFKQVIILPQGQFEKLLTCPSDEKEKILTTIFGEDKWQKIAEIVFHEAEEKRGTLRRKRDAIAASLSEEGCENMEQLHLLIQVKASEIDKLDEDYRNANYDAEINKYSEALALSKRFGDMDKADSNYTMLVAGKADRDAREEQLKNAKRADSVRPLLEGEASDVNSLAERQNGYSIAVDEEQSANELLRKTLEEKKAYLVREIDIEEKKRIKLGYEAKLDDYSSIDASMGVYEGKRQMYIKAEETFKKSTIKKDSLAAQLSDLNAIYTELGKEHLRLNEAYINGMTGFLASSLSEGDECPVCGSTHHPKKAQIKGDYVSKEVVDAKKLQVDAQKEKVDAADTLLREATEQSEKCKAEMDAAKEEMLTAKANFEAKSSGLIEGISNLAMLREKIGEIEKDVSEFESKKEALLNNEKVAQDKCTAAKTVKETAAKEVEAATAKLEKTRKLLQEAVEKNGFESVDQARSMLITVAEMNNLQKEISEYDASVESAQKVLEDIRKELSDKERPDEALCRDKIEAANASIKAYTAKRAETDAERTRLMRKETLLLSDGDGIEERIREADADWAFAKKLRGDTGTGLQRYVLGIMFSSVIEAANKMLELVHDGRYRLFRSDDRAAGTVKRGLELKAYDKYSDDPNGRFVTTMSGGEKFLVSLALSIGMSTVAQRSGVKIEALFIDEGFGTLDESSIVDAMNVLNSIQATNSLVGIISHVQILQERIPTKLIVSKSEGVSHISESVG